MSMQIKLIFQVGVLGWGILWSSLAMSTDGGLNVVKVAEGVSSEVYVQSNEKRSHQDRSKIFGGALEVLKRNPAAADVKECKSANPRAGEICIRSSKKV